MKRLIPVFLMMILTSAPVYADDFQGAEYVRNYDGFPLLILFLTQQEDLL